jgi:predicted phosphodiesterase
MKIRIIGDVHGKFYAYKEKIKDVEYSIQLGDFGFAKEWYLLVTNKIDPERHKIIPGNHDDYKGLREQYLFDKKYGEIDFYGFKFFFVQGAWSIDWSYRVAGISWWEEEQLPYPILMDAIAEYEQVKPDIMITHECPKIGIENIFNKPFKSDGTGNRTAVALSQMFEIHKPKIWIYGHWHQTRIDNLLGTEFVCLNELDHIDYEIEDGIGNDINWNIVQIKEQIRKIYNKENPIQW